MRFVYGVHPVLEALRVHPREVSRVLLERGRDGRRSHGAEKVAQAAAQAQVRIEEPSEGELARRSGGGVHQGVACEVAELPAASLPDLLAAAQTSGRPAFFVALDGVTDPHNLGALVRSAHALGAHGLILPRDRSASVTAAAAKAAAGALEHLPLARVTNLSRALEELKEAGCWSIGLAIEGERELGGLDLRGPLVLVLGSEGKGIRPLVRRHCDHLARIPMSATASSLNVSAAGAIALYEISRQREAAGLPRA